jgi:hypothetical protein
MDQSQPQRHQMLFSGAIGFYESARSLHLVTGELHLPAFYVLLAYAAELSVKAFVILNRPGANERTLQSEIGHNLNNGFRLAVDAGYVAPNSVTTELFEMLNAHHANHQARYLSGPTVEMKPHTIMLAAMAHHLTVIGSQMSIPVQLPDARIPFLGNPPCPQIEALNP